jgi:hypothetical protein
MKTITKSQEGNFTRHRFMDVKAMSVARAKFTLASLSTQTTQADAANGNMNNPTTHIPFALLKHVNVGVSCNA